MCPWPGTRDARVAVRVHCTTRQVSLNQTSQPPPLPTLIRVPASQIGFGFVLRGISHPGLSAYPLGASNPASPSGGSLTLSPSLSPQPAPTPKPKPSTAPFGKGLRTTGASPLVGRRRDSLVHCYFRVFLWCRVSLSFRSPAKLPVHVASPGFT